MNALTPDKMRELVNALDPALAGVVPPPATRDLSRLGATLAASQADSIGDFREALQHISSDVPRGIGTIIGADGQAVEGYWFGVILAARREYGERVKETMRCWSEASERYTPEGFESAWDQYDPSHPKPVTVASVFQLARQRGWVRGQPNAVPLRNQNASAFTLLDRNAILALPPLAWRVKGLFPEAGLGSIFGPSGSGKSFLVFDLAVSIAMGATWFGHRTNSCPVTYVMLEGTWALQNRLRAWEKHNGTTVPSSVIAVTQSFLVTEPQQVEDLGAQLPHGGVVIIDTLNRSAPGIDENSSQDMGRVIAGGKRLQEITGGLVLFVHHTGKDVAKGLRGHSSLHAALDGAISVSSEQSGRLWSAAKVKDGQSGTQHPFKLNVVDLGFDSDGDPVSSCAAGPDAAAVYKPRAPAGGNQKVALEAIRALLKTAPDKGKAVAGPGVACVSYSDAVAEAAGKLPDVPSNRRISRAKEVLPSLIKGGHLQCGHDEQGEEWVWL